MTAAEVEPKVQNWSGWQPVYEALLKLEESQTVIASPQQAEPEPQQEAEPQQEERNTVPSLPSIGDYTMERGDVVNITLPKAIGGNPPLSYSLTSGPEHAGDSDLGPPAGLSFNRSTRKISGTVTARVGTYRLEYAVTDTDSPKFMRFFQIHVTAPPALADSLKRGTRPRPWPSHLPARMHPTESIVYELAFKINRHDNAWTWRSVLQFLLDSPWVKVAEFNCYSTPVDYDDMVKRCKRPLSANPKFNDGNDPSYGSSPGGPLRPHWMSPMPPPGTITLAEAKKNSDIPSHIITEMERLIRKRTVVGVHVVDGGVVPWVKGRVYQTGDFAQVTDVYYEALAGAKDWPDVKPTSGTYPGEGGGWYPWPKGTKLWKYLGTNKPSADARAIEIRSTRREDHQVHALIGGGNNLVGHSTGVRVPIDMSNGTSGKIELNCAGGRASVWVYPIANSPVQFDNVTPDQPVCF